MQFGWEMQNPRHQPWVFATRKEERKNEKDEVDLFVFIVPGKC